jgi:NAD(P)-dependent dehydrogenase (short-subunit alcohol dehydrogenase family)
MTVDLRGKVAVVTGASRGVGQRMAVRLAKAGAAVALVARGDCSQTAHEIHENGGQSIVIRADVSKPVEVDMLKAGVEGQLGVPSILINNAGVFGPLQEIKDVDGQAWIDTIMVNTIAPFLLCRVFVGGMIAQGWGRIVNVSSAASLHTPSTLNSAYGTSKTALNQMTRHLAAELEGTGVTANVIHPGDVKTEMWADIREKAGSEGGYGRWAKWVEETGGDDPEKAADLVLELISEVSINGKFLWIKDSLQTPIASW